MCVKGAGIFVHGYGKGTHTDGKDLLDRVIVRGTGVIEVFTLVARLIRYSSSKGLRVWEEYIY